MSNTVLTPRQAEIHQLAQQGLSISQISGKLFIHPQTVWTHMKLINSRLVRSQSEGSGPGRITVKTANNNLKTVVNQGVLKDNQIWTRQGIECHELGADCSRCPVHLAYGMHKNSSNAFKRCYQQLTNTKLLQAGVPLPQYADGVTRSGSLDSRKLTTLTGYKKTEFVGQVKAAVVQVLNQGPPLTCSELADHFNATQLLDSQWTADRLYTTLGNMCKYGLIRKVGKKDRVYCYAPAAEEAPPGEEAPPV